MFKLKVFAENAVRCCVGRAGEDELHLYNITISFPTIHIYTVHVWVYSLTDGFLFHWIMS